MRLVAAEASGDKTELGLLEYATPMRCYRLLDTMVPLQLLYNITLTYIIEQLDQAGIFLHAIWRSSVEEDVNGTWDLVAHVSAFRFCIGREAWQQFTEGLGLEAGYLIQGNYRGELLELCQDNICRLAPTADELKSLFERTGHPVDALQTSAGLAKSWRSLLAQVCGD